MIGGSLPWRVTCGICNATDLCQTPEQVGEWDRTHRLTCPGRPPQATSN
ncbi:hypothetical protein [Nocardioides sp. GY 10127]|nr:hypothetical protein [Nocardioides sp. GY 10127]